MNPLQSFSMETECFQRKPVSIFLQDPHNRFLPEKSRQGRNTKRNFLSVLLLFESSVLRQSFFIKLQIGQHFYSRGNPATGAFFKRHSVMQYSVYPVTYRELLLPRFNMDIGSILQNSMEN